MPDVISNAQNSNLNNSDAFMDEEQGGINGEDSMLSHLNNGNMSHQAINLLSLDSLTHDPMLSASSSSSTQHHQQRSTVDISAIDPIVTNYGLISMQRQSNCDNASVESILQSDSDSLIDDIDMIS